MQGMTTDISIAASSALPLLPLPPSPFSFFPTHLSPRLACPGFSSRVELGLGCLPTPIRATNQAEGSTQIMHTNCRPVLYPHVTACCSGALPHATTHKLGTMAPFDLLDNHILLSRLLGSLY